MEPTSKKTVIPVFIFFLVLLLAWFSYSTTSATKAILTKKWQTTTGTVVSADVIRVPSSKGPTKFKPHIQYKYSLNGEEFLSDKFSSTPARGSSQWAKDVVSQHPENSQLVVYYNPGNHQKSVLVTGLQPDNYWMFFLSAFFFVVVLLAFIKQLKTGK